MTKIRRAIFHSFVQKGITFLVQFVSTIIIARILSPSEIGVYSVAAAIIGISHVLRQFGIGDYIIREKILDSQKLRASFTVSLTVGSVIAVAYYALSGVIADFYGEADVRDLIRLLSLNLLLLPVGSIAVAVLVRELEYGVLAVVQIVSVITASVLSVLLAYLEYSYYSLAISSVVGNVVLVAVLALFRPKQIVLLPSVKGVGQMLRFTGFATGSSLTEYFATRAPDLVLPKTIGVEGLGLYSRGYGLVSAFSDVYGSTFLGVTKPMFAQAAGDKRALASVYIDFLVKTSIVPILFGGFCAFFSKQIILVLFGPSWVGAAPVLMWFGIGLVAGSPFYLAHPLLVVCGNIKTVVRISIVKAVAVMVVLLIGTGFGLEATAASLALVPVLTFWLYVNAVLKVTGVTLGDTLRAWWKGIRPVIPGFFMLSPCLFLHFQESHQALGVLAIGSVVLIGSTTAVAYYLDHPIRQEAARLFRGLGG